MPFSLTMPKLSPTMENGIIAKWHKHIGDQIQAGDLIMEVATDKATVEFNAIDEGYLRHILVEEGEEAAVNQPIAILSETPSEDLSSYKPEASQQAAAKQEAKPVLEMQVKEHKQDRILASPLAKKLSEEKGIDLKSLSGTGPGGRIVSRDLAAAKLAAPASGSSEEEALTPVRKVIADRLQKAKMNIPHFYVTLEIDAEPLVELRKQLSHTNVKVSVNDLVIKGVALALKETPQVNSGFNSINQTIIRYKTVDISVAVSVESGLITPIIKQADAKKIEEISAEVRALAKKAKEGKLKPEEFQGGSFTVSNLGMYGVAEFQAIINPPQSAILAVAGIQDKPVIKNGAVVPGKTMAITLSVDHRVIDGVLAAQFLKTVQKYLENPVSLLL